MKSSTSASPGEAGGGIKIALGVTGCIAAYKSVELMRGLQQAGVDAQVILTRAARRFVGPVTFEALSTHGVITSMWRRNENRDIQHIRLAQEVRLLAVAPATANILGKFARGIADDFLSTFYLSCPAPVVLAPAMNVEMWRHPAVQENVRILRQRGHYLVDPVSGPLACGMEGPGRLADVGTILGAILALVQGSRTWQSKKVLVTAGPTVEDIDPVRFISNRSSGKMGFALAQAALWRGAEVHLVSGPTALAPPGGARFAAVRSAGEMYDAALALYSDMDVVIMAAAVADHRPAAPSPTKVKKREAATAIELVPTQDILSELGRRKSRQVLVGFAAETDDVAANARIKMEAKNLDLIVANDVSRGVFGEDSSSVRILCRGGDDVVVERESKLAIARRILDRIEAFGGPFAAAPPSPSESAAK
ncbi:MAG: bifunctional phosphopantothenoylcysteine decarboxylase/phosphopantothenate--cysteine ligase CoaBC [Acidobacteriota bacterium]